MVVKILDVDFKWMRKTMWRTTIEGEGDTCASLLLILFLLYKSEWNTSLYSEGKIKTLFLGPFLSFEYTSGISSTELQIIGARTRIPH